MPCLELFCTHLMYSSLYYCMKQLYLHYKTDYNTAWHNCYCSQIVTGLTVSYMVCWICAVLLSQSIYFQLSLTDAGKCTICLLESFCFSLQCNRLWVRGRNFHLRKYLMLMKLDCNGSTPIRTLAHNGHWVINLIRNT